MESWGPILYHSNTGFRVTSKEFREGTRCMAGSGRIACPRCGANNFDTVTVCWKCSTPLTGQAAMPATPAPVYASQSGAPAAVAMDRVPTYAPAAASGSSSTPGRAAMWLGLLFPYFGLPIGLAFMMCDDRRRQEVGRACVIWSLVSGVIHLILLFVTIIGTREYVAAAFNAARAAAERAGGAGGGMDGF